MICVRFPNGQCITYNNGWYTLTNNNGRTDIYESNAQKELIATVPAECLIEWIKPCSVTNPIDGMTLEKALQFVIDNGSDCGGSWSKTACLLSDLKSSLQNFNRQTRKWK